MQWWQPVAPTMRKVHVPAGNGLMCHFLWEGFSRPERSKMCLLKPKYTDVLTSKGYALPQVLTFLPHQQPLPLQSHRKILEGREHIDILFGFCGSYD